PAPLCATEFVLEGDRFLAQWGMGESVTSTTMQPSAVEAYTSATQVSRDNSNETGAGNDGLGGSAPAEVEFYAAVTDAAVFTEWQFSTYPDFDDIQLRISDPVTTYTFREQGTTYVRFVCANDAGTCDYTGTVFTVSIGQSSLLCPNAFSPGASEGVNDEWKVSYSSIVEFECHIFNKLGVKMASLTDPSQGWDGRYNGKLVPAGVYYYVIKARGADDKKYNLSGDINIVNYR
ncbi:MAG: gliding motility-associated C-terminal domain-containing protein, partial [Duncaniella sp.]|nr:gliding motility-associated C-terminal domain-containing protein [Duncaniella sp.]